MCRIKIDCLIPNTLVREFVSVFSKVIIILKSVASNTWPAKLVAKLSDI